MPIRIRDAGGVLRTITKVSVRDGDTLRPVQKIQIKDAGGTLRTVLFASTPMTLAMSPADGLFTAKSDTNVITSNGGGSVTPTGGTSPYSYAWSIVSGDTITINSPSTAFTTFTSPALEEDESTSTVVRCTCTDAAGQVSTADLTVGFLFFTLRGF